MKKILTAIFLFVAILAFSNVPDTYYKQEGNHYVEYKAYDTGTGQQYVRTGYCALSSSGTMRYACSNPE